MSSYTPLILILPLISAAAIMLGVKRNANISAIVATFSALATFILSVMVLMAREWEVPPQTGVDSITAFGPHGWAGRIIPIIHDWSNVPGLRLGIDIQVDPLSAGMMIVVTGVGALVHIFSLAYMKDDA